MQLQSFVAGRWQAGLDEGVALRDATTGEVIARAGADGLDARAMLSYAREVGGRNLRRLTFHERAALLKALARFLTEHKDEFYALSYATGATKSDAWIDIDGGISTLFVYASKGTRELPDGTVYLDGAVEALSKGGSFVGQHLCVPLEGAAVHINAFNFPGLGHAGEAGAGAARRRAGDRQAGNADLLPHRARVPADRRGGDPAGGGGAADLRRRGGPLRASHLPGRGVLHRLCRHRAQAAPAPGRHRQLGALHRRDRFTEFLDPRAGRRAPALRSWSCSCARWCAR